jgi:hypothetical protein
MKFGELTRDHKRLLKLRDREDNEGFTGEDPYYVAERTFKAKLCLALRDDTFMLGITRRQLVRFLSWCSSYRPVEPHNILTTFSLLQGRLEKKREQDEAVC